MFFLWVVQCSLTIANYPLADEFLVRFVPITISVLFATFGQKIVKRNPEAFYTPLPIFLFVSAIVFGVGPLYQWFGDQQNLQGFRSVFPSDIHAYSIVALLNTTGLMFTLSSLVVINTFIVRSLRKSKKGASLVSLFPVSRINRMPDKRLLRLAGGLILLEICVRVMSIGLGTGLNLPGFLSFLGFGGWLAAFILGVLAGRKGIAFGVAAVAVALIECWLGLIAGIRTAAVAPLVLVVMGLYTGTRSMTMLTVGVGVVFWSVLAVTPVVEAVRYYTWFTGTSETSAVNVVSGSLLGDLSAPVGSEGEPAVKKVWSRLDYSQWQASMMQLYDSGRPGNTYDYIPWSFVPRVLVPSKPVFDVGHEIGYAVQGVRGMSSFSGTVFGEMYWNGGWTALVISSLVYGAFLAAISYGSLWLFLQFGVFSSLVGLSGILYGFVVDETFSVSVVGKGVIFLVLFISFQFIRRAKYK